MRPLSHVIIIGGNPSSKPLLLSLLGMTSRNFKYNVFYLPLELTSLREQKDLWLVTFLLLIIRHPPVWFSGRRFRGNGDKSLFISRVTWRFYVINRLCDFVDNIFSSEATSLSNLIVIGLVEVKKLLFSFVSWSPYLVIKRSHDFVGGAPPP